MAYVAGDIIAASDLNGFINVLDNIWSVGFSSRGYGQTGAFVPVQPGDIINGVSWSNLIPRISTISLHQSGNVSPETPLEIDFNTGEIIEAKNNGVNNNLPGALTTIDSNRLNAHVNSLTTFSGISSTRVTSWGDVIPQLVHEFTVNFAVDNTARYFFNSGGSIVFNASRTGGSSTSQNVAWHTLLDSMGSIIFNYTNTTFTGIGIGATIGYYQLRTYFQRIARASASSYGVHDYAIYAKTNDPGINGGNGSQITFRIEFNNGAPYGGDPVDGTLVSNCNFMKATTYLSITSPVFLPITNIN